MEQQLDAIQEEIIRRINKLFQEKFDGNQRAFGRAANCDPKTIRDILNGNHFITVTLAFKMAYALDITASGLFDGLMLVDED